MTQILEIFEDVLNLGCCQLCAFRYMCIKTIDLANADEYLQENNFVKQNIENQNDSSELKRVKNNPCVVCLGLLQQNSILQIIGSNKLEAVKQYDTDVFTCSISMPAAILLREHSMKIYLQEKYASFYEENVELPLNKAWKAFIKNELSKYSQKTFENSDTCNFFINISMDYPNDVEELNNLKNMQPKLYEDRLTQHRKYNGGLFSRKGVLTAISKTSSYLFKENYPVPPIIPTQFLILKDIECKHNSIFFAGRYLKFSRELSQSPWIVDGVKAMETSVQEIIFDGLNNAFGISENNLKFSSSGREDCDVRCLGKGRPFYIEVLDPKKTKFSFEEFRTLEKEINKSEMIKVLHLQLVERGELSKIKEGEEVKTKDYIALCLTKEPVTEEQIKKINNFGKVEILQKTPIRVLHRRPLAIRKKVIYEMKATTVEDEPYLMKLYLNAQAGTYVKEFVHGDFGRSTPNIGEIIGNEVDIIALDVTAINLDWPTEINYDFVENVT